MEKYVFSGALTKKMVDELWHNPKFEPLDILESQLNRSSIKEFIKLKHEGFCRWLFIDSGAYSVHTGKAKGDVDEYISYLNSIDDDIDVCAQLDTIPGHFGKPKSPEDYVESAKKSWDNFLYMRGKLKSPHKLMPVMHQGESLDHLKYMLAWKDENGKPLDYIGISPANDNPQKLKNVYMDCVTQIIAASENPDVKTHLYGMTSLPAISQFKCYSADSISHRLMAGYCRIFTEHFGVISLSERVTGDDSKSKQCFIEACDDASRKILDDELAQYGYTAEELQKSIEKRVAFNILSIQHMAKTKYKYTKQNAYKHTHKLF